MPTSTARPAKMTKKDMEKFRRLLNEKKTSLSADLAKTRNAEEETSEEATQDIADKAVSSYTREFLYSLSDNDRNTDAPATTTVPAITSQGRRTARVSQV